MLKKNIAIEKAIFQELVSLRITARVEIHCGANTYHARSDSAVAKDQWCAIIGSNCRMIVSALPDVE